MKITWHDGSEKPEEDRKLVLEVGPKEYYLGEYRSPLIRGRGPWLVFSPFKESGQRLEEPPLRWFYASDLDSVPEGWNDPDEPPNSIDDVEIITPEGEKRIAWHANDEAQWRVYPKGKKAPCPSYEMKGSDWKPNCWKEIKDKQPPDTLRDVMVTTHKGKKRKAWHGKNGGRWFIYRKAKTWKRKKEGWQPLDWEEIE